MPGAELVSGSGKLKQTPSSVCLQKARLHIPLGLWVGQVPRLGLTWGSISER